MSQQTRNPHYQLHGVLLGAEDTIDILETRKEQRRDMFEENPEAAVENGYTDENGIPLRKEGDPGQGMEGEPLGSMFLRNYFGVELHDDKENDFFVMTGHEDDEHDHLDHVVTGGDEFKIEVTETTDSEGNDYFVTDPDFDYVGSKDVVELIQSLAEEFVPASELSPETCGDGRTNIQLITGEITHIGENTIIFDHDVRVHNLGYSPQKMMERFLGETVVVLGRPWAACNPNEETPCDPDRVMITAYNDWVL